ncbi:MAG: ATP phosphoribosyltransferase regulatory subunit [Pyrinomonadaceae bacterium]
MHVSKIPSGLRYYTGNAARMRRAVEDSAIAVFAGWSYEEIITPTVDYYSLFEQGMGAEAHSAFRFTDSDGRLLALRPDVTSSVARACATLLAEKPRPLRLCYAAPVFHQRQQTRAEWRRESTQLGCELIGAGSLTADIEPLAILAETLNQWGLEGNYCITLNHVELFNGIAEHLKLNPDARERLRGLIDVRDTSGLIELLDRLGVDEDERRLFARVTRLSGKRAIVEEARKVIRSTRARAALDALEEIWQVIEQVGMAGSFEIDLGDVSGLAYYTGLLFKVYVRGSGIRVGRGGRYDRLTSIFGRAEPAIGFVLDLDALTEVIAETSMNVDRRESSRPVEINSCDPITDLRDAMQRRAKNERVNMVV